MKLKHHIDLQFNFSLVSGLFNVLVFTLGLTGCFQSSSSGFQNSIQASPSPLNPSKSTQTTQPPTSLANSTSNASNSTLASGIQSVKVFFKTTRSEFGSFPPPPSSGTENIPEKGLFATKLFKPDHSVLVHGDAKQPQWPTWLKGIELTLSGTSNLALPYPRCAQFFNTGAFSGSITDQQGEEDTLQVSEADCGDALLQDGKTVLANGGPNDGFSIRIYLEREAEMGYNENLLLNLQYEAYGSQQPSALDLNCTIATGIKKCPEMLYQLYLKNSAQDIIQPFVMLIPPVGLQKNTPTQKQIFIPLAAYPQMNVIQISRIFGLGSQNTVCKNTLSPRCLGVIFHSLNIHRI